MLVGCIVLGVGIYTDFYRNSGKLGPILTRLNNLAIELQNQTEELNVQCQKRLEEIEQLEAFESRLEPERFGLQKQVNQRDMVEIPGGAFLMGADNGGFDEKPCREVVLDGYLIDKFPVTNQEYKLFVYVTGHRLPPAWSGDTYPLGESNQPVTNVSWDDAQAYAEWVAKRLPTEAEWEKASRGIDGRAYPWGDAYRKDYINAANAYEGKTPVNKFPDGASPFAVMDTCGNVLEWCADWYDSEYYRDAPRENPKGPVGGQARVVRGGGYTENSAGVRCAARHQAAPGSTQDLIGFRCAKDVEPNATHSNGQSA